MGGCESGLGPFASVLLRRGCALFDGLHDHCLVAGWGQWCALFFFWRTGGGRTDVELGLSGRFEILIQRVGLATAAHPDEGATASQYRQKTAQRWSPLLNLLGDVRRRLGSSYRSRSGRRGLWRSGGAGRAGGRGGIELGHFLFQQRLVFLHALDFFIDLELGGDALVDIRKGALFLPQLLPRAIGIVFGGRVGQGETHSQGNDPVFETTAEDQAVVPWRLATRCDAVVPRRFADFGGLGCDVSCHRCAGHWAHVTAGGAFGGSRSGWRSGSQRFDGGQQRDDAGPCANLWRLQQEGVIAAEIISASDGQTQHRDRVIDGATGGDDQAIAFQAQARVVEPRDVVVAGLAGTAEAVAGESLPIRSEDLYFRSQRLSERGADDQISQPRCTCRWRAKRKEGGNEQGNRLARAVHQNVDLDPAGCKRQGWSMGARRW